MYFLLFILTIFIVYMNTFKNEFDKEDLGKATLFLVIGSLLVLAIGVISNL